MAIPAIQNSFAAGELSPSMLGRQDLPRYHIGCSTLRNMLVSYKGPGVSRAGFAFCGFSKQTGRAYPPRLIPFQFNVNQGLALEFGDFYMRVLFDGAFVTEDAVAIANVANGDPAFISVESVSVATATVDTSLVTSSYAPGEVVTLAGGVNSTPAQITINSVEMIGAGPEAFGTSGYAPGDTITLTGGTGTEPIVTVPTTQVVSATVVSAGSGGLPATGAIITGTTGTGVRFQASVDISGGAISSVPVITLGGAYTVNPTTLTAEPVTGGSLSGATLHVHMGVQSLTVTAAGDLTAVPVGDIFTQGSTSGGGTGATVLGTLFAPKDYAITNTGSYATPPANPVKQASTTGTGAGVQFDLTFVPTGAAPVYQNGDWVFLSGIRGPTGLNGQTVVVGGTSNAGFQAFDVYGAPVSTAGQPAYAGGGTAARVYTLATQWGEQDLPWLKFQESADEMTLCDVNQLTAKEYPPIDLQRITDSDWVFTPVVPMAPIAPPASVTAQASFGGNVNYEYQVTTLAQDGTESIASSTALAPLAVDVAVTTGTITVTWSNVPGALAYYVYKASPGYLTTPPVGAEFGFAGQALGLQFLDTNITPDFSQVPPQHRDPFARGQVLDANPIAGGSGYTFASVTMNTATGAGAVIQGIVVNGAVLGYIVEDPGHDYAINDTGSVAGDGAGALVDVDIGPQTGTYPSVPNYFQERRVFANSLNNPDTYWMSQPGSFSNFDVRNPTIPSDAITGNPWSVQVNGVQWMVQTPAGLLIMTGLSAWILAGVGSFATNVQPISPSNQDDVPQAFTGCSPLIPPIRITNDVIFVNSKGSYYYDLPYQLYAVNEPVDITEVSSHLFTNYTVVSHAWCEQPDKVLWSVRSDGVLLSLTWYKAQQVAGWGRHDTAGAFVSNCSVVELPVDAHYAATQRFAGTPKQCYMIERMADRTWTTVESAWCVDAGLQLPQPAPDVTLTLSSAAGSGAITGYTNLVGGAGYSAGTTFTIADTNGGQGVGATVTGAIVGGAVTALTIIGGAGYKFPEIKAYDPANTGAGFSAKLLMANTITLRTGGTAFGAGSVGSFVRAGGGIAEITAFVGLTQATASVLTPFPTVPNTGGEAQSFAAGAWTLTAPVSTVTGLQHLEGQTVTGLADGNVIPPTVVANGAIPLTEVLVETESGWVLTPIAGASAVTVGLGFTAQLQSMPLDLAQPTVQGSRKNLQVITARLEASLGVEAVANQVDGSLLSPSEVEVDWSDGAALPDTGNGAQNYMLRPYNALATPLQTGDRRASIEEGLSTRGQIALIQTKPLPMNVLALIPELVPGDTPVTAWPQKQGKQR